MNTSSGSPGEDGCEQCRDSDSSLETIGSDLHRVVIENFEPQDRSHRLSYQNDFLRRCPACGTTWLSQFWEVDTPETAYEEWGLTYVARTALTTEQVQMIDQAILTGSKYPHGFFWVEQPG